MKKILAIVLALVLCLGLTACGGGKTENDGTVTIKVGASPAPHAELLELCVEPLAEQGITLEIVTFEDYVLPNTATEDGSIDANFFQHTPYLTSFNESNGTHLVSVGAVHYEPLGIYAGTASTFDEVKANGGKIAVPNDASNEARALLLLEANGLITLDPNAGINATKQDITENPYNIEIVEIEAAQLTAHLPDVALAVINGNFAIAAGLSVADDTLAIEEADSAAAQTYANILVVKEGNENNEAILALLAVLQGDIVKDYIAATYDGAVVSAVA